MRPFGLIYLIVNLVNGKMYVGQTVRLLQVRWNKHLAYAEGHAMEALCCAIRKHGVENFIIFQIDAAKDLLELNQLETFYIKNLNTISPYGYNLTYGGEQPVRCEETCKKISASLLGHSMSEASREKSSKSHIRLTTEDFLKRRHGNGPKLLFCQRGHPFDEVNTYISPTGRRQCLTCCYIKKPNSHFPERLRRYLKEENVA